MALEAGHTLGISSKLLGNRVSGFASLQFLSNDAP